MAGTLLGFALYVFGNLRNSDVTVVSMCLGKLQLFGETRRIANPVPLLAAASACVMISTAMGAWGALLKKHGVLKVAVRQQRLRCRFFVTIQRSLGHSRVANPACQKWPTSITALHA